MGPSLESEVLAWDGLITSLARKRCRQVGADFDDLQQEGRLEILTRIMMGETPTENHIVNAMRRYLRSVREGREIVYEPSVQSLLPLSP